MKLTDKQALLLSQLAYLNLHRDSQNATRIYKGKSLKYIIEAIIEDYFNYGNLSEDPNKTFFNAIAYLNGSGNTNGGIAMEQFKEILLEISKDATLGSLVLTDYVDNNASTGFVAYAFKNPSTNESVFAFRGTDDGGFTNYLAWPDNFAIGTYQDSIQKSEVQYLIWKKMKVSM